jgi:hypothetical protein
MAKKFSKTRRGFIRYTTYNFVEKDPVIDVLRTMQRDSGMSNQQIAEKSKVSEGTIHGWFSGRTKRPQFATVAAAAVAMGFSHVPLTIEGRQKLKG